jgi:hypothetical protein
VATLVSVLLFYRERVGQLVRGVLARSQALRYAGKLVLATRRASAVTVGDFLESQFESAAPRPAACW